MIPHRILIVDDLPADRLLIRSALLRAGDPSRFDITEAETMDAALRAIAERNPDVVLLDLMLPDSRGADTVAQIRAASDAAIVVLTVVTDEELALQSLGVGAHEYLLKSEMRTHPLDRAITYAVERRRAEKELQKALNEKHTMETRLLQTQKLEAVGQLAGGVAHDFNNLLTIILGVTGMLYDDEESAAKKTALTEVMRASERAASLTRQLLTFAQRQVMHPQPTNLNEVLMDFQPVIAGVAGEAIDVAVNMSIDAPTVYADRGQLEQTILNLVLNARDAMSRRGSLTISTQLRNLEAGKTRLAPGRYAVLSIHDDGPGIDEKIMARIFEPFFTTRHGLHRGLGLPVVQGFIRQSGGDVIVRSTAGSGTAVLIYLPLYAGRITVDRVLPSPSAASPHTILVVEDESGIRDLLARALRRAGHTVLTGTNGEEALTLMEDRVHTVDLVITDIVMPRMNGNELAARLHEMRSDLPILFISGYSSDIVERDGKIPAGAELLQKPFTLNELMPHVDRLLEKRV